MQYVKLGNTGLKISRLGFGGIPIQRIDQPGTRALLEAAHKAGINYIDTARGYTVSEEWIGQALEESGLRDEFVLASKCRALTREEMEKELAASLKNLRTDHIDLYYQHRLDPRVPVEVVAETVADLIREGKVRAWGLSMVGEDALRRAHAVCPVSAVQNLYNLTDTHDEALFPVVEELGITYVSACPLSKGLLSGAYSAASTFEAEDFRSHMPQFTEEGFRTYAPLIPAV